MLSRLKLAWQKIGRWDKVFTLLLILYLGFVFLAPASGFRRVVAMALFVSGLVVALRLIRTGFRKAIWRLRNRLVVCYLFIGVVPIILIVVLVGLSAWVVIGQVAINLVTTRLEQQVEELTAPAQGLAITSPEQRAIRIGWVTPSLKQQFPGLQILIKDNQAQWRYPSESTVPYPPEGWGQVGGLTAIGKNVYLWAHAVAGKTEVNLIVPVDLDSLAGLVPHLGEVTLGVLGDTTNGTSTGRPGGMIFSRRSTAAKSSDSAARSYVPAPANQFDIPFPWGTVVPVAIWDTPGKTEDWLLGILTRPSAVLRTIYSQKVQIGEFFFTAFLLVAGLFLVVELVSLIIGISITRSVTGAVHNLYEGTQKVMRGDFSHRISVKGTDQLASLSVSFNRMTENLERLVEVEKEQQRMQSELEIAREVQKQLFPKNIPDLRGLQLTARCDPARMVSGDYYDYVKLENSMLALALGDVAGKGISAALLMAAVQSTMRTQLTAGIEWQLAVGNGHAADSLSSATIVSRLNQQLYANTSAEKYATFYFAVYDDEKGLLTYTNAGHLPPVLLRKGVAQRLDVNGMVVGAFPFARYEQSTIHLKPGDLLTCFTDGVTEPENEYGEQFGEERLIQALTKNVDRDSEEIIEVVMDAVREWTGSPELQDDMTMLLARKL